MGGVTVAIVSTFVYCVLSVRHYLGDQDRPSLEINHPVQSEFVSADVKDGLTINQIRAAKRPFQFGRFFHDAALTTI
jgi:hypothetical protein